MARDAEKDNRCDLAHCLAHEAAQLRLHALDARRAGAHGMTGAAGQSPVDNRLRRLRFEPGEMTQDALARAVGGVK